MKINQRANPRHFSFLCTFAGMKSLLPRPCLKLWIHVILLCAAYGSVQAQPTICVDPIEMTPFCEQACIICDIDGFKGRHESSVRGEAPPGFCSFDSGNMQWIAFLAGSTSLTVDIEVSNCDNIWLFSGLQMGLYESLDCQNFRSVSNCEGGIFSIRDGQTGRLTTDEPLTIGQYYYIVMDGAAGDNCDWEFKVVNGDTQVDPLTRTGDILVDSLYCSGEPIRIALDEEVGVVNYLWEINKDTVSYDSTVDTMLTSGSYEICVTGSNVCNEGPKVCDTIIVLPVADTIRVDTVICASNCFDYRDSTYCVAGTYYQSIATSADSCDTPVRIDVEVRDAFVAEILARICVSDCYRFRDSSYCESGQYAYRVSGPQCDSIYNILVEQEDDGYTEEVDLVLCQGDSVELGGVVFYNDLEYFYESQSSRGCDTLIRWSVAFEESPTLSIDTVLCVGECLAILDTTLCMAGQHKFTVADSGSSCELCVDVLLDFDSPPRKESTHFMCVDDCFTWRDTTICMAGRYQRTVPGPKCDTIYTVNVITEDLNSVDQRDTTVCAGEEVIIQGVFATGLNSVSIVYLESVLGCDSVIQYQINIEDPFLATMDTVICAGGCLDLQDTTFCGAGLYTYVKKGPYCDSTWLWNVVEEDRRSMEVRDTTFCAGQSIVIDTVISSGGEHLQYFEESVLGCDSIIAWQVEALDPVEVRRDTALCVGEWWIWQNDTLDAGEHTMRYTSAVGCDSLVIWEVSYEEDVEVWPVDSLVWGLGDVLPLDSGIDSVGASIQWSGVGIACPTCHMTEANPLGASWYAAAISLANGCMVSDSLWVEVRNRNLVFPNVFSPNGDGRNEVWTVPGTWPDGSRLVVYDRWGNLVYEEQSAMGRMVGWDGRVSGQVAVDGVYVYMILGPDDAVAFSGTVTLLR